MKSKFLTIPPIESKYVSTLPRLDIMMLELPFRPNFSESRQKGDFTWTFSTLPKHRVIITTQHWKCNKVLR